MLPDIVPALYYGDEIDGDFANLEATAEGAAMANVIRALLVEISASQDAMWMLTSRQGEYRHPSFNSKAIEFLQRQDYNLYRIRPEFSLANQYRVIYAYDSKTDEFFALAVVRKKPRGLSDGDHKENYYDYENNHPITKRVCDEYEHLGIPKIRSR